MLLTPMPTDGSTRKPVTALGISRDRPGDAVIFRHDDCGLVSATSVWHIDRSIRSDFDVAVDSGARSQVVDWDASAEGYAAIVASGAERSGCFLRAIVNRVWIKRFRRRVRRSIR